MPHRLTFSGMASRQYTFLGCTEAILACNFGHEGIEQANTYLPLWVGGKAQLFHRAGACAAQSDCTLTEFPKGHLSRGEIHVKPKHIFEPNCGLGCGT